MMTCAGSMAKRTDVNYPQHAVAFSNHRPQRRRKFTDNTTARECRGVDPPTRGERGSRPDKRTTPMRSSPMSPA